MRFGLALNEDASNYFYSNPAAAMTREAVAAFAGHYAQGQVREVFWNPNAQRVSYGTLAPGWDPVWRDVAFDAEGRASYRGQPLDPSSATWIANTKALADRGVNPYAVWLERTRAAGREGWISMRMTDLHMNWGPDGFNHNTFWRENPRFRRYPGLPSAIDYGHPEVRAYAMGLVDEYFDLFDMDGLEIDWMRFAYSLRDGFELLDAHHLTQFMRDVRARADAAAKRRGHPVKLAVRVPSRPDDARRMGYDVAAWADEKLVDMVTPTNFWPTTDHDMPMELWRRIIGPDILLAAGMELWVETHPGGALLFNTPEMLYGFAAQYWHRGVDRIYLFNYMIGTTGLVDQTRMPELLATAGSPETVNPAARRHYISHCVTRPAGLRDDHPLPFALGPGEGAAPFRLNVGGATAGREAWLVLGASPDGADWSRVSARVNHVDAARDAAVPPLVTIQRTQRESPELQTLAAWKLPPGALHDGDNFIEARYAGGAPLQLDWLEIHIAPAGARQASSHA